MAGMSKLDKVKEIAVAVALFIGYNEVLRTLGTGALGLTAIIAMITLCFMFPTFFMTAGFILAVVFVLYAIGRGIQEFINA